MNTKDTHENSSYLQRITHKCFQTEIYKSSIIALGTEFDKIRQLYIFSSRYNQCTITEQCFHFRIKAFTAKQLVRRCGLVNVASRVSDPYSFDYSDLDPDPAF